MSDWTPIKVIYDGEVSGRDSNYVPPTSELIRNFSRAFKRPINDSVVALTVTERELLGKLIFEECIEYLTKGLGLKIVMPNPDDLQAPEFFMDAGDDYTPFVTLNEGQPYDPIESADGLGDMNVVIHFNALWHGFNLDDVTREIHESNMSKLGEDGEPIINACQVCQHTPFHVGDCELIDPTRPAGKILKGPNFRKPDIAKVIYGAAAASCAMHVDPTEVTESAKQERCPDHPDATFTGGFGLAGGGYGYYDVCDECGRVFNKHELPDDEA